MSDYFRAWNQWLGKRMFLVTALALLLGFFIPVANTPFLQVLVIALFAYMTFVTALETSLRQFASVLSRPWVPLWILALAHLVTPAVAWLVGFAVFPEDMNVRIGYLISASIPVGVTSVIWTSLVKGNVPVSLVTVTLDTMIVPALLPFFFMLTIGKSLTINYGEMAWQLLWMITLPSIAGMLIHDATGGKVTEFAKGVGGFTSKIALFVVIVINAALVLPGIAWDASVLKMLLVTLFMVVVSYFIGYAGSFALKDRNRAITLSMIYNVGLRNISAGLVLALTQFPPAVAVPVTLFILYQQPLASIVPMIYRRFGRQD